MINLPTNSPAESLTFYEHEEGDTFRRIRDNGEPGERLEFERRADGRVSRFKSHGNYSAKIEKEDLSLFRFFPTHELVEIARHCRRRFKTRTFKLEFFKW